MVTFPKHIYDKLQTLPDKPGVYLMRDRNGKVIYVGKAKSLRNRVRSYFQQSTLRKSEPKRRGLIKSIYDFDIIPVRNDDDAYLTEGRLIKEYSPYYNTLYKDDKRFVMLSVNLEEPWPRFETCRINKHDGKTYFGPYVSGVAARATKDYVEKTYGIRNCRPREPDEQTYKHCNADIIRRCTAPCIGNIDPEEYRNRVHEACAFLKGERPDQLKELEQEMHRLADHQDFEAAAALRDTLLLLRKVIRQRATGKKDLAMLKQEAEQGLTILQEVLRLEAPPSVIETFDISNISGTYAVASMVVSLNGFPSRNRYRRFRIKTVEGANDPEMMGEAVERRYRRLQEEQKPMPDLIMVDGGITQLRAAKARLDSLGLNKLRIIGIAKRYEELYWDISNISPPIRFPLDSPALRILQNIRDEAHRFALTYHRNLRNKRIRDSILDEIPGIGEKRKQVLLQHFGSVLRMKRADIKQLKEVPGIGDEFAQTLYNHLHPKGK